MAEASIRVAAILLVAVPTVEVGGVSLLAMITRKIPGYLDTPCAGTCSAPGTPMPASGSPSPWWSPLRRPDRPVRRLAGRGAPGIRHRADPHALGSLSILRPDSEKPHGLLRLTILGGPALAVATVTLGIGLLLT